MTLLAQAADVAATDASTAETIVFYVFAALALGSGLAVITMRNIVHGALMLVLNLLAIAGLYLALESTFLSIIQVLVYAGAITVLFLFVIMLLGIDRDDLLSVTSKRNAILASAAVALLAGALLVGIVGPYTGEASLCNQGATTTAGGACIGLEDALAGEEQGSVSFLGERMFTRYTFPFELSALLLTVATIGATLLGRRRDPEPDDEDDAPIGSGGTHVPADVLAADLDAVSEHSDARVEGDRPELRDAGQDPELDRGRDDSSVAPRGRDDSHPHRDTPEREG
ncbi:MAG: NADH-quinone oxidoreductase subunit J [Nitriliruptor sp.]|uniref:NADH-quinone oxidoreductase subunit J n=1 Tax=Nitriliruptor sp. TaxID=2448056 RepID=UPI00349FDC9C